jgi:plasmid stabilization system protein ParE
MPFASILPSVRPPPVGTMAEPVRVIFSTGALSDLDQLFNFLAVRSPQAAKSEIDRLLLAIQSLEWSPTRYARVSEGRHWGVGLRRMPLPPYRIYYRLIGSTVYVLAVHHGARQHPK